MFAIKSLRINRFRKVSIPSPRALFEQLGYRSPVEVQGVDVDGEASSIRDSIPSNVVASKISALALAEATARKRKEFEENASHTKPLTIRELDNL